MDYKDSLNLAQSDFAMRGNLPENEPLMYEKWQHNNSAYNTIKTLRSNASKTFNLHDGPPYANGNLHIGHALNKILKDIVLKIHYFNGENIRYTPGWDCHGLPIEQQIEKTLGKEKKEGLKKTDIRELCRAHASKYLSIQSSEFQQMGVIGDFMKPYKTMDFAFEANIYRVLCEVAKKGLLAQRTKPIFWSWAARSALAEAEVEYKDKEDYSIFVSFALKQSSCEKLNIKKLGLDSCKAVIWTTTPWTLVSNQAIALATNEKYVITKEGLIFAKTLLEKMVEKNLTKGEILIELPATEFEFLEAINPLNNKTSILLLGEHVSMDTGSGLVHSAPGHGEDDYKIWLKYGKDNSQILMPVDDRGCYDETLREKGLLPSEVLDEFIGLHIFKANKKIIDLLGDNLLSCEMFIHSYPHCWRTHEPVIYRATKQWFILMDKPFLNTKTLREVAMEAINNTIFYPKSGANRISAMIANRPDWCISRQRDWGVPIAFFINKKTKEPLLDEGVLDFIADVFEKEGCDVWWDKSIEALLPSTHTHLAEELEKK